MRIETYFVTTIQEALEACSFEPFCIVEVEGGYKYFESENDFIIWDNQQ